MEIKKANRKENNQVNFRVTAEEYERLQKNAKALSMSNSAYAKFRLQSSKDINLKFSHEDAVLFLRELGRIGTNMNQIARFCNQISVNSEKLDMQELITAFEDVSKKVSGLWQQLN